VNKKIKFNCYKENDLRSFLVTQVCNIKDIYPGDRFNLQKDYNILDKLWHDKLITDKEYGYNQETDKDTPCEIDIELEFFSEDRPKHVVLSWDDKSRPISLATTTNETIELDYKGGTLYDLGQNIAEALNNISTSLDNKNED
jgi:hypothetical protein|tara:strand:+ start:70 stop:495 length:426 start_codon:yes stop_codon:yes gene_type:complete